MLATALCAQNWSGFRGPMGQGVADGMQPPVRWDGEKGTNILWKTPIPGISVSSPVVWGDRVYAVTSISSDPKSEFRSGLYGDTEPAKDNSEHTWKVYSLDLKTGKILWEQTALKGIPKSKRHPKASQSSPSPVTDGKRVIAWFGSEGLFAYDVQGKLLWKKDLGVVDAGWFFDPDYQWGVATSPIIWKDRVILQVDQQKGSFLASFDAATGKEQWRVQRDEIPTWGTPAVLEYEGKAQLVTNGTKGIRSYDPLTGKLIWQYLGKNSEITCPVPVLGAGLIYVTNGYPPAQPILAIKWGATGDITLKEGQETNDGIAWSKMRGGSYQPSPLLYGDLLYLCGNSGILTAYNAKTGERVYQQRIAGKGGAFSASPIASDGKIYLASEDGEVHVVKAGATYETLASNPMGEVMMGTPALAKGVLVVRGMKHIFAVAEKPAQ
jgi:outer membrane protein assembly factor BamB